MIPLDMFRVVVEYPHENDGKEPTKIYLKMGGSSDETLYFYPDPQDATIFDEYLVAKTRSDQVIRNSNSNRIVYIERKHLDIFYPEWVICGLDDLIDDLIHI